MKPINGTFIISQIRCLSFSVSFADIPGTFSASSLSSGPRGDFPCQDHCMLIMSTFDCTNGDTCESYSEQIKFVNCVDENDSNVDLFEARLIENGNSIMISSR